MYFWDKTRTDMKYFHLFILFLGFICEGFGQKTNWRKDESFYLPATQYVAQDNPYYWKRRKPFADYWQQDVHYRILANIVPEKDMIEGVETLTYRNNSPDKLDVLYFHLYQNAFTPNSNLDKLSAAKGEKINYGKNGNLGKGNDIIYVMQDGKNLKFEIQNTIMKVYLNHPLLAGENTNLEIEFATYFSDKGGDKRRMKKIMEAVHSPEGFNYEVAHYDGVHWYPRVAVYDRKFRWCLDQHLGNEFYGDFGSFDVHLTFPAYYIVEATGELKNETMVMSDSLKKVIDISLFAHKKNDKEAKELFPKDDTKTKCWIYHAINVHDFAFTADPTYRRSESKIGETRCIAMVRERKAGKWIDAAEYTAKFINVYNNDIGKYMYPKMVVADADDGMEYPMLTLDGGSSPEYYGLLAHEIGHNWFYGMVGNNETYRAFLDEGFTQFLTVWSMEKVVGKYPPELAKAQKIVGKVTTRQLDAYGAYLDAAIHGDDGVLNTHSDDFGAKGNSAEYGQVYTKTAVMLYNLRYVLGDQLFLNSLRFYFNKWKLKHPYPEDFRQTIIEYTHTDLNWFFDQWLDTDKYIDYGVKSVRHLPGGKTSVTFIRKGTMQMPIDFLAITSKGTIKYHIPNTEFIKVDTSARLLPKWYARGDLNPEYTVVIPHSVKNIIIDPQNVMADVNLLNNRKYVPLKWKFDLYPKYSIFGSWENYAISTRPHIWWNGYSGLQAGFVTDGSYMKDFHQVHVGIWANTGLGQIASAYTDLQPYKKDYQKISYTFRYATPIRTWGKASEMSLFSTFRDGAHKHGGEISFKTPKSTFHDEIYYRLYARYTFLYRPQTAYSDYLAQPEYWNTGKTNSFITVGYEQNYPVSFGKGKIDIAVRASSIGSQAQYGFLSITNTHVFDAAKFRIHTRMFGRYGIGNAPNESALYLAGANPEEMFENGFYRARGFVPLPASTMGGGLNLRGYAARMLTDSSQVYGSSGAAINIECDFNRWISSKTGFISRQVLDFRTYLFYDGGILGKNQNSTQAIAPTVWGNYRQDIGIGTACTLAFPRSEKELITLRADIPFWVSEPAAGKKPFGLIGLISFSKTF